MRRKGLAALLGIFYLVLIFVSPSLAQVIKLTLAEQNPEMGWGPVHAVQPWVKKIEEVAKGRVKIEVFYAQTLAKAPGMWNAVKTGVADMGLCSHTYWPDMTPLSDVILLPSFPAF